MARTNAGMTKAKKAEQNEFYTQYKDIQKEIDGYVEYNPDVFRNKTILLPCDDPEWSNFTMFFAQNFERFGIKKLISTSYATKSKEVQIMQPTLFETESPHFDANKTDTHGKIFVLDHSMKDRVNVKDLQWDYLEGDGDFRSEEVKKLRDEADIIITNPPFSLFSEFFHWIREANKQFLIISGINNITYKEVFVSIMRNETWAGHGMGRWISGFIVPDDYPLSGTEARIENGKRIVSTNNCMWLTNIEHGKRHEPLQLMTMADNLRYSKHEKIREQGYPRYDNFDAIHVCFTDAIPSDYDGIMAVPITFLDKYNPDQFEIIGEANNGSDSEFDFVKPKLNGEYIFKRLLIRKRNR